MKLIRILRVIDSTIEFVSMNRKYKFYFYSDLKKNIYENNRTELSHKIIQQILFIDNQALKVEWQNN